jgi:transglutaminase-like putative cysteine protease
VLLAALMLLATGWAVFAGGWKDASPSALGIGLVGLGAGVVAAGSRLPRWAALLLAPVALLASLLPTTVGTRPSQGGGIAHLLGTYAHGAVLGLLGSTQWEFNVGLSALLWVCGAWAAWFAIRERRGALATGPCWAVLGVNVINAPTPSQAGLPALLAAGAAILLIAAVHLDRLNDSWRRRSVAVLPGTDTRFAAAAGGAGVLAVLIALLAPPLTSSDVSGRLFGFGGGGSGGGGGAGGHSAGTVRFNPSTILGGKLTLSNQPVLTYRTDAPATTYLRMSTASVFLTGNWVPDSTDNNADVVVEAVPPGAIDRDRTLDAGGVGAAQRRITATVVMSADTSGSSLVPFPGEPDTASVALRVTGLSPPSARGSLLTVDSASATSAVVGPPITAVGTVSTASAAQLRSAGTSYPGFITRDGFLFLPDDATGGAAQVRSIAQQWTINAVTAYDKAAAIENRLRNPQLFRYTLSPPLPTDGTWPLVYFLTQSHAGYCQYYASAMGAMLRALGIPARLVNGYGPGSAPEQAGHNNNVLTHTVTSNDAHTWVEAYFVGYGWVPFEPTPPSTQGDYQPFVRGGDTQPSPSASAVAQTPTARATAQPAATPTAPASSGGDGGGGRSIPPALAGAALGLLGTAIVALALVTWFLRPRTLRGVWRRVGMIGRLLGVRRDRTLTFAEYSRRLALAVPPDTTRLWHRRGGGMPGSTPLHRRITEALAEIAAVSDRATYAAVPPHPRETVLMRRSWRRIARATPRLGWRALLRRSATP